MLRKVNTDFLHETLTKDEREYFIKSIVVALNNRDNFTTRQNITQLISNLLMPLKTNSNNSSNSTSAADNKINSEELKKEDSLRGSIDDEFREDE